MPPASGRDVTLGLGLLAWVVFFTVLWLRVFRIDDVTGITTTSPKLWADWALHLGYTTVYAHWPPGLWFEINLLSGLHDFQYPILANLISGLLLRAGLTLQAALIGSSLFCSLALVAGVILLFRLSGFGSGWALLGSALFLFNGGAGFVAWLLADTATPTDWHPGGLILQNFITSEFIPQRSMLHGGAVFVFLLCALVRLTKAAESTKTMCGLALCGLCAGLLMLAHPHSLLSFALICTVFALSHPRRWRSWLVLAGTAALACSASYFSLFDTDRAARAFLSWDPLALVAMAEQPLLTHLLLNFGLFLPVVVLGLLLTPAYRSTLVLAGLLLFVLCYTVRFQPWAWDNSKILTWGYLLLCVAALHYLRRLWHQGLWQRGLVAALAVLLCSSGAIEVAQILRPDAQRHTLFSASEKKLAAEFAQLSEPNDRVLTVTAHTNWVHALAARPVFQAYPGWLASYGLDIHAGAQLTRQMLDGDLTLMREHGIEYIVLDRRQAGAVINPELESRLTLLLSDQNYHVYHVPGSQLLPRPPGMTPETATRHW